MPNDTIETATTIDPAAFTYDFHGTAVDIKALPESSALAMIRRGLSHYAGNELASKVAGFKERYAKENNGAEASAEAVAAYKAEAAEKMHAALVGGTIGVRSGGSGGTRTADPVERESRKIARAEIEAKLKAKGLKAPSGDKTITFADGSFTMEQLIARRLANEAEGPRIRKAAEKALASIAKTVGDVTNVDISVNGAEALGL